ncbi:AAA family ATPase [Aestuariivirga sp.]|uniref:AAA family ATPase n=1 Tax=Aestuariivirga sp. TaxID=2650926 RepID=UPI003BAD50DD
MNPSPAEPSPETAIVENRPVAIVPRINIHAFCETPQTLATIEAAFADRRMSRAHGSVESGGILAAVRYFQSQSTPNLLLVESTASATALLAELASLADVCQPQTKVVVIGQHNDVLLYRELIRQGVSEYVVAPSNPIQLVETIAGLYRSEKAQPVGRVISFIAARGGTGSSTVAHNCAWNFARTAAIETVIVDLDLHYGTAALNFNADSSVGILEALSQPERVDGLLLDRLLIKLGGKLSLLSGPGGIERDIHIEAHAVETILTALRSSVPCVVVDLPHCWSPWVKFTLQHADQIVITAEPDLASLRNARYLVDLFTAGRPNDPPPRLLLNQVGAPKRAEISSADFAKAVGISVSASIPNDPQNFGAALNNGKILLELAPKCKPAEALRNFADSLLGSEKPVSPTPARPSFFKRLSLRGKT